MIAISNQQFLQEALNKRAAESALRKLTVENGWIDFCSNDYLGFARSTELTKMIENEFQTTKNIRNGSSGSRLLAGNTEYAEVLEKKIAAYHGFDAALLYNSGYDANIGLFSCIAKRGDTIIYDELIHASVRDGVRLSFANNYSFKHNDIEDLEQKIKSAKGRIFLAVESVYSMDGDCAPLKEIATICEKYAVLLIVDEAHSIGVFGKNGKGMISELQLEKKVFATVFTFGKAMGCDGAVVCGSDILRNYLINFSRSFIYTTAKPLHGLISINCAYELLKQSQEAITTLKNRIRYFQSKFDKTNHSLTKIESESSIQCLVIPGNESVKRVVSNLQKLNFDVRAILYPTVPKGLERIRICLHTYNTETEIEILAKQFQASV